MKKPEYDNSSIQKMDELDHVRARPSMYIGSCQHPTHLFIEVLDNALDECQNGYADKLFINIDNKKNKFEIADNGRGIPFDPKATLEEDRPVLICNSLFTSGKFKKESSDSAYDVAAGLHGVGLTAVRALSEKMYITVNRNNVEARYKFTGKNNIEREFENKTKNIWSTQILVKPNKEYFEDLTLDLVLIKERLLIAGINFPNIDIDFTVDGKKIKMEKGTEKDLISNYLGKNIENWYEFETTYDRVLISEDSNKKNKCKEYCKIIIGWDFNSGITKNKEFTTINLTKVQTGVHVVKLHNIIKTLFTKLKKTYEFDENDILAYLRCYINLKIVDPHFESQTKERLSRKTKLEIFDNIEKEIEKYFKKNKETTDYLFEKFQEYHKSLQNKKVKTNNRGRALSQNTKLRDCLSRDGELIIGEGDSAMGGVLKMRDKNKHAVLPLRGVPPNAMTTTLTKLMENVEARDIILAVGTGTTNNINIANIRYSKIILAADADPAGHFINVLLIGLFIKLMPEVIKEGYLYLCEPPLYGYGKDDKMVPLWTEKELDKARASGKHIRRFKGLGEYSDYELQKFILNPNERKLVNIVWNDNELYINKIKELLSSNIERRLLALGEWVING